MLCCSELVQERSVAVAGRCGISEVKSGSSAAAATGTSECLRYLMCPPFPKRGCSEIVFQTDGHFKPQKILSRDCLTKHRAMLN